MNYVFDSSALIYFGKLRLLEKIALLPGKKLIPKNVYEEVVMKGLERKEPEAQYIENLIEKNKFIVQETQPFIEKIPLLSKADLEVLFLAKKTSSIAIMDEIYARNIAEAKNIRIHGSVYLLLKLVKEMIITKQITISYLNRMIDLGFYLSITKYKEILKIIENI